MKSFLGQFLFSCFGFLLLTSTAFAVSCHSESPRSATAADAARWSLDFATAERLYAAELKSSPDSEDALIGYSISPLDEDKLPEALAAAQNAIQQKPKSAALMAVLGEIQFRLANLKEAGAAFQKCIGTGSMFRSRALCDRSISRSELDARLRTTTARCGPPFGSRRSHDYRTMATVASDRRAGNLSKTGIESEQYF